MLKTTTLGALIGELRTYSAIEDEEVTSVYAVLKVRMNDSLEPGGAESFSEQFAGESLSKEETLGLLRGYLRRLKDQATIDWSSKGDE